MVDLYSGIMSKCSRAEDRAEYLLDGLHLNAKYCSSNHLSVLFLLCGYRGNTVLYKLFVQQLHTHPLLVPYDRDNLPLDQLPWNEALTVL